MKRITATKTARYADPSPSVPHYSLVKGEAVDLPDHIADRVLALEGGVILPEEAEAEAAKAAKAAEEAEAAKAAKKKKVKK